jgi:hypothetical protein
MNPTAGFKQLGSSIVLSIPAHAKKSFKFRQQLFIAQHGAARMGWRNVLLR